MHVVCKKNPTIYFLWTFSMKANCFGNFAKKQSSVEIVQKSELLWKLSNKAKFCGNIPTKQFLVIFFFIKLHIFVEILRQISVYFDGGRPARYDHDHWFNGFFTPSLILFVHYLRCGRGAPFLPKTTPLPPTPTTENFTHWTIIFFTVIYHFRKCK